MTVLSVSSSLLSGQTGVESYSRDTGRSADTVRLGEIFDAMTCRWEKAYNSGDAANLLPLYSDDARYISSHVSGLVAGGRDKVVAYFQAGINSGGHIDSIRIERMDVSCEIATLFCTYQATNSGITVTGHNLMVLRQADDGWVIILHMTVV